MAEKAHDKFLNISDIANSMFSENVDLYEKIMELPVSTKLEVGGTIIEREDGCAYISSISCMVESTFYIVKKNGSFDISSIHDNWLNWSSEGVSGRFTFDALEDFTIMIDDFRTYGIRVD